MPHYTADVCDALVDRFQVCALPFHNCGSRQTFEGRIVTLRTFEYNAVISQTLDADGRGKVLVVDGGGSLRRALVGGNVAKKAADNGWEGIVIFGCVRDQHETLDLPIGIKAFGVTPVRPRKDGTSQVDEVVQFGGVTFRPGDYLYADLDGVVVCDDPVAD